MTNPHYRNTWVDASDVNKSTLRSGMRDETLLTVTVAELQAMDTQDHRFALIVLTGGNVGLFKVDTGDSSTADDGATCIVSNDGDRFKILTILTAAQILALYASSVPQVSTGEITAGTEAALRTYAPADIVDFIAEHESGEANFDQVSSGEITAGTETALRSYSPEDIVAFITEHGAEGGGSAHVVPFANRARVSKTSAQTIPNTTPTAIQFNVETYDIGGWADLATHNTRLTVPADVNTVMLGGFGYFDAASGTAPYIKLEHFNSSDVSQGFLLYVMVSSFGSMMTTPISVSEGDYFVFSLRQNSGGSIGVNTSGDLHFAIFQID